MATITVNGKTFEAADDTRLILALRDAEVDILHRCGGYAKCTTCRVTFETGEPNQMTQAEHDRLNEQGNLGKFRLSCQIPCAGEMTVSPLMSLESTELDDRGSRPENNITPDPQWIDKPE